MNGLDMDTLTTTFSALADPTRRSILQRLADSRELTVNELAEPFAMTLPAISKHLKVLESAGLVTRTREGVRRPAQLSSAPLQEADAWLQHYRRHWERQLDGLGAYLDTIQQPEPITTEETS